METFAALASRRHVRNFSPRPIEREHLDQILEVGRRAPSAGNAQPWDFVVSTEPEQLAALARTSSSAAHVAESAANVTLVLRDVAPGDAHPFDEFDLGQAVMAMALAATDLGIGSGHAAIEDAQRCAEILGVPGGRHCAYFLALGYPADRPLRPISQPKRRPFAAVVHWGRF